MKEIKRALQMRYLAKMSLRQVAEAIHIPHTTVADYCKRFEISGCDIASFLAYDEEKIEQMLFTPSAVKQEYLPSPEISHKRPIPDVIYIHKELSRKGVTFELLWQEYKECYPEGYGITQFKEYYYRYKKKIAPSMRQMHLPGEKLFIDYSGLTMPITNQVTGEITKAQIFVAVLGASGYTFVHATPSQCVRDFITSHVHAFAFFKGAPAILVPDNLKSAIIANSALKGIVENESYGELARHYNCLIIPARPRKPKDKPKVEQGVQGIQRWLLAVLRDRVFFSVDELNLALAILLDQYNQKLMRHLGKSRLSLFEEIDAAVLQPLPQVRFIYKEFKLATVHHDYHVCLEKCYYSVPYTYLKEKVELRYSTTTLEIYHKSKLIATHPKYSRAGSVSTLKEHMPLAHQYQHEKMNPQRLLDWATSIGEHTHRFVEKKLSNAQYPMNAYRSVIAILNLSKAYGKSDLDLALAYALGINALSYKSVISILSKKLYLHAVNNTDTEKYLFNKHHANIRGSGYYQ